MLVTASRWTLVAAKGKLNLVCPWPIPEVSLLIHCTNLGISLITPLRGAINFLSVISITSIFPSNLKFNIIFFLPVSLSILSDNLLILYLSSYDNVSFNFKKGAIFLETIFPFTSVSNVCLAALAIAWV